MVTVDASSSDIAALSWLHLRQRRRQIVQNMEILLEFDRESYVILPPAEVGDL